MGAPWTGELRQLPGPPGCSGAAGVGLREGFRLSPEFAISGGAASQPRTSPRPCTVMHVLSPPLPPLWSYRGGGVKETQGPRVLRRESVCPRKEACLPCVRSLGSLQAARAAVTGHRHRGSPCSGGILGYLVRRSPLEPSCEVGLFWSISPPMRSPPACFVWF